MFDDLCIGALTPDLELVNGGSTEGIGCCQENRFALPAIVGTQLPDGRRLADAIRTDHE